jgi:hypothetical protein
MMNESLVEALEQAQMDIMDSGARPDIRLIAIMRIERVRISLIRAIQRAHETRLKVLHDVESSFHAR